MLLNAARPYTRCVTRLEAQAALALDCCSSNYKQATEDCVSSEGTLGPLLGSCERGGQKPTLLPNCKEPGCITLLAALSIPGEGSLSRGQAQPPPRAAPSALQLGGNSCCKSWLGWWPEDAARAAGSSPLPATNVAPAGHVGVGTTTSVPVCSRWSPRGGGTVGTGTAHSTDLVVTQAWHWPAWGARP